MVIINTVNLIGYMTKDVNLRQTQSGKSVGSFTLAVNRNFKNQQGEYETDFIQCVIWDKGAENIAQLTTKGSRVGIEGRIQTGSYDNNQGQKVYTTDIVVNNFHLIDTRAETDEKRQQNGQGGYQQQNMQAPQGTHAVAISEDEIPF